jgi:protein-disulfide isomerase
VLEQVLKKYPERVKIVFKNFPLRKHKYARQAAIAALAAGEQGKFWKFHDLLFKDYNRLNNEKIREISGKLGLDMQKFATDTRSPEVLATVTRDMSDAARAGVRGTPTVFINGRLLRNRSLRGFQVVIEKELVKARKGTD